jgi:Ca-activated chloride channel homolog
MADLVGMALRLSTRHIWPCLVAVVLCAGSFAGSDPENPSFRFHTAVNEIRLTFSATDQNDHAVSTLQARDVAVVDQDIVVREFQSFARSDQNQLEIAILADTSESVPPRFRRRARDIVAQISQSDAIADETLSIFSFRGAQPALVCAGNCRVSHAVDQLPDAQSGEFTPLFDTIVFASDFLARRGNSRTQRILVILSDGADTISRSTLAEAIGATFKDDVQIYGVSLNDLSSAGTATLHRLCSASGGQYFPANANTTVLDAIVENLQATYIVSYGLPSRISGFHTVRVLPTHNPNLQFRSRSGYYFPDDIR